MCLTKKLHIILILFMTYFFATSAMASISPFVNFQGFITNSDGEAVTDGNYSITFSLWDGENENFPNNLLWEKTHIIPVERGIYSVSLGPFPYTITFAEQYYVGIQIDGGDYLRINNSFIPITTTWTAFRSSTSGGRLVNSVSQDYTVTETDDIVLGSGNTTITLPEADDFQNRIFTIKKTDSSNTLLIATKANETMDGVNRSNGSPITLTEQFDEISMVSDGQNWLSIHTMLADYSAGKGLTLTNGVFSIQQGEIDSELIASGAITDEKLNLNAIKADSLTLTSSFLSNAGSLTTLQVWGLATMNTITSEHINITSLSLGNATINTASPGTSRSITIPNTNGIFVVTSDGSFSITSTDIQNSAVTTTKVADNAITTDKILDGTITDSDLSATLNLSTVSMNNLTVSTKVIANSASLTALSLSNAAIAVASPGNAKTITIPDADGIFVVTSDGAISVTTTNIQNSAINTNTIADNAVTSSKISDGTITGNDLSSTLSLSAVSANILTISNSLSANTSSLTELTVYGLATINTIEADSITVTGRLILPEYDVSATSDGQISWDSTNDKLYVGTSAGTSKIRTTFTTYTTTSNSVEVTVTCGSGLATGGGCSSGSANVNENFPTCNGVECTNNVTTQNGWHCTFSGADVNNTAFVICSD
ncbi:MAG: hypothetical protein HQK75_13995 [Candidatus Magnetomorum sp.]|nr:hypothetical protein [Candidatus Magnetomorum sp.]